MNDNISSEGVFNKPWGYELIWASNQDFAAKIMVFAKENNSTDLIFHKTKNVAIFINAGKFKVKLLNTKNASFTERIVEEGGAITINPMQPYQFQSLQDNSSITLVSSADNLDDVYTILIGQQDV